MILLSRMTLLTAMVVLLCSMTYVSLHLVKFQGTAKIALEKGVSRSDVSADDAQGGSLMQKGMQRDDASASVQTDSRDFAVARVSEADVADVAVVGVAVDQQKRAASATAQASDPHGHEEPATADAASNAEKAVEEPAAASTAEPVLSVEDALDANFVTDDQDRTQEMMKQPGDSEKGTGISQVLGSDLLGDPFEPTEKGTASKSKRSAEKNTKVSAGSAAAAAEEKEFGSETVAQADAKEEEAHKEQEHTGMRTPHHGYMALLFFFGSLMVGSLILFFLERHLPSVPYTCALFIIGALMLFVTESIPKDSSLYWNSWIYSVHMWKGIDPHMLFYSFLPALIFAEAMKLNVPLFKKCFKQVFLLACPGVLFGTGMIALFSVYVLPYGWDWPIALVFGSILSATDPVAVVALFGTLGVAPRLTMLISGESLLNDGTAMVIFSLMLKVTLGATLDFHGVIGFFACMSLVGVVFGAGVGFLAVICIGMCAEENYHSDTMIQVIITISCAFITFFLAESELSTSGMLATVSSGVMVATYAWPRFVSKTALRTVWEAIEFMGNTIIFLLAGLLFANLCLTRQDHLQWMDVFWLLVLYPTVIIIRAMMLALLWFPLRMVGTPIDWREGVIMIWSGLRGAVGLAMAIIVDREPEIPVRMGSRVMFLVGGMAGLTTVINATTTPLLLKALGLSKTHSVKERVLQRFRNRMADETEKEFKRLLERPVDFSRANAVIVREMVPDLKEAHTQIEFQDDMVIERTATMPGQDPKGNREGDKQLERICRETFLQLLQTHYWNFVHEGILARSSKAARLLLNSVNEALDNSNHCLDDWNVIARSLKPEKVAEQVEEAKIAEQIERARSGDAVGQHKASSIFSVLGDFFSHWLPEIHRLLEREEASEVVAYVALAFVAAHKRALIELPQHLVGTSSQGDHDDQMLVLAVAYVKWESMRECMKAEEILDRLEEDAEVAESQMLARKLLHMQLHRIEQLGKKGVLTHKEGVQLETHVHNALRTIVRERRAKWMDLIHAGKGGFSSKHMNQMSPTQSMLCADMKRSSRSFSSQASRVSERVLET